MFLNKAILVGRITKKPELRATKDQKKVTNFGIAISETYKTNNGEKKEVTDFIDVAVFGNLAETCAQWLMKGQQVLVEGKIKTRKYEVNGENRYQTFVQAVFIQFGAKPKGEGEAKQGPSKAENGSSNGAEDKGFEYPEEDINPDDIPF